jgi:hypothetical protein
MTNAACQLAAWYYSLTFLKDMFFYQHFCLKMILLLQHYQLTVIDDNYNKKHDCSNETNMWSC